MFFYKYHKYFKEMNNEKLFGKSKYSDAML